MDFEQRFLQIRDEWCAEYISAHKVTLEQAHELFWLGVLDWVLKNLDEGQREQVRNITKERHVLSMGGYIAVCEEVINKAIAEEE